MFGMGNPMTNFEETDFQCKGGNCIDSVHHIKCFGRFPKNVIIWKKLPGCYFWFLLKRN